jgi:hypothetical protein
MSGINPLRLTSAQSRAAQHGTKRSTRSRDNALKGALEECQTHEEAHRTIFAKELEIICLGVGWRASGGPRRSARCEPWP